MWYLNGIGHLAILLLLSNTQFNSNKECHVNWKVRLLQVDGHMPQGASDGVHFCRVVQSPACR